MKFLIQAADEPLWPPIVGHDTEVCKFDGSKSCWLSRLVCGPSGLNGCLHATATAQDRLQTQTPCAAQ